MQLVWGVLRQRVPGRGYVWLRNCCVISEKLWVLKPCQMPPYQVSKGPRRHTVSRKGCSENEWKETWVLTSFSPWEVRSETSCFLRFHMDETCQESNGSNSEGKKPGLGGAKSIWRGQLSNDGKTEEKYRAPMATRCWNKNLRREGKCFCVVVLCSPKTLHSLTKTPPSLAKHLCSFTKALCCS